MFLAQRANRLSQKQQMSIFRKNFTKFDNTKEPLFRSKVTQHYVIFCLTCIIYYRLKYLHHIYLYLFWQRKLSISRSKATPPIRVNIGVQLAPPQNVCAYRSFPKQELSQYSPNNQ